MTRSIFLFIIVCLPYCINAQSYDIKANKKIELHNFYPTGSENYNMSIMKKRLRYVDSNETVSVIGYNPRLHILYVYNPQHMGYIYMDDQNLYKFLKKAKVLDYSKSKNMSKLQQILNSTQKLIDEHYNKLEEERIIDEKRKIKQEQIEDSVFAIIHRDDFVKDSLANRTRFEKDSLEWIKQHKENEKFLSDIWDSRIRRIKSMSPIAINIDSWNIDEYGGVTAHISVVNCSSNTIKYITFKFIFINPVGDLCVDRYSGKKYWSPKGVGPIESYKTMNCEASYNFDTPSFYSSVIETMDISNVTIQYMDGKIVNLGGKELKNHLTRAFDWYKSSSNPLFVPKEAEKAVENYLKEIPIYEPLVYRGRSKEAEHQGNLKSWLECNLIYPPAAEENGIQGNVIVEFVIEKDGSVSDVIAIESPDPSLSREAVSVVKRMPKWKPAMRYGNPKSAKYSISILFDLSSTKITATVP